MSQHGALTTQQAQYVAMVAQGRNHTDIAKVLRVDRRTLIRWNKLPQVQTAIAEANSAAQRGIAEQQQQQYKEIAKSAQIQTVEIVERLLPAAVKTVAQILTNQESKDSDRLRASELIAKWGGLEKVGSQPQQQTSEQVLNLYLANLSSQPHANTQN